MYVKSIPSGFTIPVRSASVRSYGPQASVIFKSLISGSLVHPFDPVTEFIDMYVAKVAPKNGVVARRPEIYPWKGVMNRAQGYEVASDLIDARYLVEKCLENEGEIVNWIFTIY